MKLKETTALVFNIENVQNLASLWFLVYGSVSVM